MLLLIAMVASTSAQIMGVDITGTQLVSSNATSALACAQLCDGNKNCVAWSWDLCGGRICTLKSTIATGSRGLYNNTCRISDVRAGDVGFDRPGYDFQTLTSSGASACAFQCRTTAGCVAWSFGVGVCHLKQWAAASVAAAGVISGVTGTSGNDYATEDVLSVVLRVGATTTDCAKLCESNQNCSAWVFAVPGSAACVASTTRNTCWLKRFVSGQPLIKQACRAAGLSSSFYDTSKPAPADFKIASVVELGNQTDDHGANHPSRDGGAVGSISGKVVWFWSDTTWFNSQHKVSGSWFHDNTAAIGTYGDPINMVGPQRYGMPYTPEEMDFNTQTKWSPRTVLWPKAGVVETSPGVGYMFVPRGYDGSRPTNVTKSPGAVVVKVTIGADGYPNATRVSNTAMFSYPEPIYGSHAAVADQDYMYLYANTHWTTWSANLFIARVPLGSALDKSQYEYYNNANRQWEPTAPLRNDSSKAIARNAFGWDGSVYYSSLHRKWVFVYNDAAELSVNIKYASAPQGPFSSATVLKEFEPPLPPTVDYIYATTGTNLYDLTGLTMSTHSTWAGPGDYTNRVLQVQFAR